MSSIITGEAHLVFAALHEAYAATAAGPRKYVLTIKILNDPQPLQT